MRFKVMTFNIRHGRGMDRVVSLRRVAEVIRREKPHLLGINEADKFNIRSFFTHQPKILSRLLDMHHCFGQNLRLWLAGYGNAVFSRLKLHSFQNLHLPSEREQRGCLHALIETGREQIAFLVTHLGLDREERRKQIQFLAALVEKIKNPLILTGDFNCEKGELLPLLSKLKLASRSFPTYPAVEPVAAIDHILCSHHFRVIDSYVVPTNASDHRPVVALLERVD